MSKVVRFSCLAIVGVVVALGGVFAIDYQSEQKLARDRAVTFGQLPAGVRIEPLTVSYPDPEAAKLYMSTEDLAAIRVEPNRE